MSHRCCTQASSEEPASPETLHLLDLLRHQRSGTAPLLSTRVCSHTVAMALPLLLSSHLPHVHQRCGACQPRRPHKQRRAGETLL